MDEEKRRQQNAPVGLDEKHSSADGTSPHEVAVVKDGIKTHPQPTADPLDPLNWSWAKKHTILAIVMYL